MNQTIHFDSLGFVKQRQTTLTNKDKTEQITEVFYPLCYNKLLFITDTPIEIGSRSTTSCFANIRYTKYLNEYIDTLYKSYFDSVIRHIRIRGSDPTNIYSNLEANLTNFGNGHKVENHIEDKNYGKDYEYLMSNYDEFWDTPMVSDSFILKNLYVQRRNVSFRAKFWFVSVKSVLIDGITQTSFQLHSIQIPISTHQSFGVETTYIHDFGKVNVNIESQEAIGAISALKHIFNPVSQFDQDSVDFIQIVHSAITNVLHYSFGKGKAKLKGRNEMSFGGLISEEIPSVAKTYKFNQSHSLRYVMDNSSAHNKRAKYIAVTNRNTNKVVQYRLIKMGSKDKFDCFLVRTPSRKKWKIRIRSADRGTVQMILLSIIVTLN